MSEGWLAKMTMEMEREKPKMLDWIEKNVKRSGPIEKPRIKKAQKIYVDNKLVKRTGGRTAEPDTIGDILKHLST